MVWRHRRGLRDKEGATVQVTGGGADNLSMFKRSVIGPLHKERLVEFDQETESVFISPLGLRYVEANLLGQSKT